MKVRARQHEEAQDARGEARREDDRVRTETRPRTSPPTRTVGRRVLALLLWAASLLAAGEVQAASGTPEAAAIPAASETNEVAGRTALAEASARKQAAYKLTGESREQGLLEAAREYGAVADKATHGVHERAEGAFRAGEILRARGQIEESVERFVQATELGRMADPGRGREFGARGLLEQAHVLRRAERPEEAIVLYRRAGADFPDQTHAAAQGASWICKVLLRLGRIDEAGVLAEGFAATHPSEPIEAVRAVDEWALALVQDGRRDEARAAVERLREALRPITTGDDEKLARKVTDALGALRVTVSLSGS